MNDVQFDLFRLADIGYNIASRRSYIICFNISLSQPLISIVYNHQTFTATLYFTVNVVNRSMLSFKQILESFSNFASPYIIQQLVKNLGYFRFMQYFHLLHPSFSSTPVVSTSKMYYDYGWGPFTSCITFHLASIVKNRINQMYFTL